MGKYNFRKIPKSILQEIEQISSDNIDIGFVKKYHNNEIREMFNEDLLSEGNKLKWNPPKDAGKYSKKNIKGYEEVHKDLPKVSKSINLGPRPKYGDWSNGSFDLIVTRKVYRRTFHEPKNLEIEVENLREITINNEPSSILYIKTSKQLDKKDDDFQDNLLFHINILKENFSTIGVFPANPDEATLLKNIYINWEILPPGEGDSILNSILEKKNISEDQRKRILHRKKVLQDLSPSNYVYGFNGTERYFGAMFSDKLVAFENLEYGNAIYVMYDNWKELSQKSKSELLNDSSANYDRIIHNEGWEKELKRIIKNKG